LFKGTEGAGHFCPMGKPDRRFEPREEGVYNTLGEQKKSIKNTTHSGVVRKIRGLKKRRKKRRGREICTVPLYFGRIKGGNPGKRSPAFWKNSRDIRKKRDSKERALGEHTREGKESLGRS